MSGDELNTFALVGRGGRGGVLLKDLLKELIEEAASRISSPVNVIGASVLTSR